MFEPASTPLCAWRVLSRSGGFRVADVHCRSGRDGWGKVHEQPTYTLVFVSSGCFARRANGAENLVDAGVAYFSAPGVEQQFAHPTDCGDRCMWIDFEPCYLASLWGGDPDGLPEAIFSTPALDLAQRRLLAICRDRTVENDLDELVANLAAAALFEHDARRVESGYKASAAARRRTVRDAREMLVEDPSTTLQDLARELAVSPHHLSRIFSATTGASITTYRNRLRARAALDMIADGERSLTRVAAVLGFSDHAHLTRTIRSETGLTPAAHRRIWNQGVSARQGAT